jgi:hypothetical protein
MDERDWLTCTDPPKMFDHLTSIGPLRMRKLRLFAIACARRVEYLLTEEDEVGRQASQVAEQMVDGRVDPATIARLHEQTRWHSTMKGDINTYTPAQCARHNAVQAAYHTLQDDGGPDYRRPSRAGCARLGGDYLGEPSDLMEAMGNATNAAHMAAGGRGDWHTSAAIRGECGHQAALLRDIFGNPFRPVSPDPSWRTSDVLALAQGIYEERAFDRMPILADALQEAGCDNTDVLGHCRGPGPHVRGCWVVDLLLGRG